MDDAGQLVVLTGAVENGRPGRCFSEVSCLEAVTVHTLPVTRSRS